MENKIFDGENILKETLTDVTNDLTNIVKSCNDIEKNFYSLLIIFNGESGKEILEKFKRSVAKNCKVPKKVKNYIKNFHFEEDIFSGSLIRLSNAILNINKYLSSIYDVATNMDLEKEFKNSCNIMHKELANLKMLTFILDYIGLVYIDTVTFIDNRVSALVLTNNITSRILNNFKIVEMKMVMYLHYKNL